MKTSTYLHIWALCAACPVVQAQTEKGSGFWTGGFGGQFTTSRQYQNNADDLALQVFASRGVFARKNFLLGAEVTTELSRTSTKAGFNFDTRNSRFESRVSVTPFARRYWGPPSGNRSFNWRVYLGVGLSGDWERVVSRSLATTQRFSQTRENRFFLSPELQAGFVYFITNYWGIEAITRSSTFPLTVTNLGVGLLATTGRPPSRPMENPVFPPNQFVRSNWLVAGGFELTTSNRKLIPSQNVAEVFREETGRGFSINPSVGYLVNTRLVVGLASPVAYSKLTDQYLGAPDQQSVRSERWTVGIHPFVKQYVSNRRLTPYAAGELGWEWTDDSFVTDTYRARLSAGLAYLIGTRFILEGELVSFAGGWVRTRNDDRIQTFSELRATLRPGFTVSYVFL